MLRPLIRPRPWTIANVASSMSARSTETLSTGADYRHYRLLRGNSQQNIEAKHAYSTGRVITRHQYYMPARGLSDLSTNTVDAPSTRGDCFRFLAHESGCLSSETKRVPRTEGKVSRYRPQFNEHGFSQFVVQSSEVPAFGRSSHRHNPLLSFEDKCVEHNGVQQSIQQRPRSSHASVKPAIPNQDVRSSNATAVGIEESSLLRLKQHRHWEALLERYNAVSHLSLTAKGFNAALEACSHLFKGPEALAIIDAFRSRSIGSPTREK